MHPIDKETIDKVLNSTATKKEARQVAEWFSDTAEGQAYLSELMDHEAAFIESNPDRYSDLSAVQSANMLAVINKRIRIKKTRRIYWQVAAALIPLILVVGLTIRLNSQVNLFGKTVYSEVNVPKGKQEHIIFRMGVRHTSTQIPVCGIPVNSDCQSAKFFCRARVISILLPTSEDHLSFA